MWPEKGSSRHMYSKALLSFSSGTCHATSDPCARLVASSVWRIRRIVPARSMARNRSTTVGTSTPDRSEITRMGFA